MDLTPYTVTTCLLTGVAAGALSALCGVGGGIIMVPAFVGLLAMGQKNAVATSLAAIIVTALASSVRNTGNQLVDWRVTLLTGLSAAAVAWFASGWLKSMSNVTLTRLFGVFVLVMGVHMLWSTRHGEPSAPQTNPIQPAEQVR
jgi:uncharacterized membrane protein YfcA